jgi:hypothetical protein
VAGYKATGQVTRERRKKPFQLARGAIEILQRNTELGFKTISPAWFRQYTFLFQSPNCLRAFILGHRLVALSFYGPNH